jgi:hypothetical protein
MPSVKLSRILASVLGVALGLLPIAPSEHMHEAEEHGHVHALIHRHLQPHGILEHHAAEPQSIDDHDDDPVLTLTNVYSVPVLPVFDSPPRIVSAVIEPPQPRRFDRAAFCDSEILIHGPPLAPTPPRAPPSSLAT